MATDMEGKSKRNLTGIAYNSVMGMILSRELPGGTVIQERKLAESLGISRTPMREALGRLEGEGLLVRLTERLLSVRVVALDEYLQALHVRRLLESEAITLAAPKMKRGQVQKLRDEVVALANDPEPSTSTHWKIDDDLHNAIADACGNAVMARVIRDLRLVTQLFEIQTIPTRIRPGCEEHLAILDAIAAGDAAKARKAMKFHLDRVRAGVMDDL